jgi:hypothetical protein
MKRREQAKLHALDKDQSDVQRGEHDDGDHDVLQSNVEFASLRMCHQAARRCRTRADVSSQVRPAAAEVYA